MLISSQPMRVISKQEAIQIRMLNQQLLSPLYERPEDIVAWQGAMQAQDYNYFRWAIGIRQRTPQLVGLQEAFAKAELLRLHLLRCTVQVVSHTDIGWLLPLCKERNLRTLQSWHKSINVSFPESYFEEITRAMQELLAGGKSLPKKAIAEKLTTLGFLLDDRLLTSLLVRMEIEGLLCSGEMQGREATWALLSERVPIICSLTPDEALKQLALKYFRSHSPASLEDFVWWSGLTKTQCRKALALIAREIEEIKIEEEMMYLYHKTLDCPDYAKMVLLLPPYDEYLIGYKSRWVALEKKHTAKAHNNFGIFNPVILHEGRVVGNWKASIDKQAANLTIDFFAEKSKIRKRNLQGAVNQFVEFCKVTANRAS
jgi:hypothetical protein